MTEPQWLQRLANAGRRSVAIFLRDVGHGLFEVSHNMLALLGLLVVAALVFALGRADVRAAVEERAYTWLQAREAERVADSGVFSTPDDAEVASQTQVMAVELASLDRQQTAVTQWLARRYKVAPEPVARLVKESWQVGQKVKLEPTLILAIVAIESSFNPFAQSPVGAQGLMQVMTHVHNEKYQAFGGKLAAFDPVTNLRVGVQVLKECIARAGGLEAGLRFYVGAANLEDDGGYAAKVLAEQKHLAQVAAGKRVAITAPNTPPTPSAGATADVATAPDWTLDPQRVALVR